MDLKFNNEITQLGDALEQVGQLIRRRAELEAAIEKFESFQTNAIQSANPERAQRWADRARMDRNLIKVIDIELGKALAIAQVFLQPTAMARVAGEGR